MIYEDNYEGYKISTDGKSDADKLFLARVLLSEVIDILSEIPKDENTEVTRVYVTETLKKLAFPLEAWRYEAKKNKK